VEYQSFHVKHSRLHENYTSCIAQKQRACKTTATTNELHDGSGKVDRARSEAIKSARVTHG